MENRVITGVIGVFVVICLVGAALVPLIDSWAKGESETNEGAGWLRMEYASSAPTQIYIRANVGDEGLTVERETVNPAATETQTGQDDTIIYASSNLAAWMQDGQLHILGQKENGMPFYVQPSSLMIDLPSGWDSQRITYDGGSNTILIPTPDWAYIPKSNGNYAFFTEGTSVKMESDKPLAAVGAGNGEVYAYNNIIRFAGLGVEIKTTLDEDGNLNGAHWGNIAASEQSIAPFDPSTITIQPLNPSIIDPEPDVSIMSVPTPSYTDGDWGYNLATIDGVQKALIVSYSGSGGNIIVPATIGGYDVHRFGKNTGFTGSAQVFDNATLPSSTLTLSEGIVEIGNGACDGVTNISAVTLPDSLKTINNSAFKGCHISTENFVLPDNVTFIGDGAFSSNDFYSLHLPDNLITISSSAFSGCLNLEEIVIPPKVETIGSMAFKNCDGTKLVVVPESVTSIGGSAFGGALYTTPDVDNLIVASNATPGSNAFYLFGLDLIVDLSEDIDYSTDRYGAPETAAVTDTIGYSIGYISFVEIGSDPILSEGAAALMLAIPVVIFGALIAVGAAIFIRRE